MGVVRVDEVCPLDGDRLLIFATEGAGDATIFIVSHSTGAVLDSFLVQTPSVSPDQHWLAMRDWMIPSSRIPVSDQYMLYDLTKNAAANRRYPGAASGDALRYGRTMYPVVRNHVPFENHGVEPEQVHGFGGGSIYWSADSKYVVFEDRFDAELNVVLVKVEEKNLTAMIHPLFGARLCGPLSSASVTAPRYDVLEVQTTFQASECTSSLTLHDEDFQLAKEEVYPPRKTVPSHRVK
jgi:hypothetical protein